MLCLHILLSFSHSHSLKVWTKKREECVYLACVLNENLFWLIVWGFLSVSAHCVHSDGWKLADLCSLLWQHALSKLRLKHPIHSYFLSLYENNPNSVSRLFSVSSPRLQEFMLVTCLRFVFICLSISSIPFFCSCVSQLTLGKMKGKLGGESITGRKHSCSLSRHWFACFFLLKQDGNPQKLEINIQWTHNPPQNGRIPTTDPLLNIIYLFY